jgi:hypothetical protein
LCILIFMYCGKVGEFFCFLQQSGGMEMCSQIQDKLFSNF